MQPRCHLESHYPPAKLFNLLQSSLEQVKKRQCAHWLGQGAQLPSMSCASSPGALGRAGAGAAGEGPGTARPRVPMSRQPWPKSPHPPTTVKHLLSARCFLALIWPPAHLIATEAAEWDLPPHFGRLREGVGSRTFARLGDVRAREQSPGHLTPSPVPVHDIIPDLKMSKEAIWDLNKKTQLGQGSGKGSGVVTALGSSPASHCLLLSGFSILTGHRSG